jgi:hypothetical protein
MNKNSDMKARLGLLSLALAASLGIGVGLAHAQTISVSIPALHMTSTERVVGFEIHITSGRVARLSDLPIGWNISVDNDASWNTVVKGSSTVGAAARDASFFRRFMIVEINESLGIPFDVQGEVIVTKDFATERRIKIALKDLAITKLSAKGARNSR